MNPHHKIYRLVSLLSLIGLGLLVFAFFTPDAGQQHGSFFHMAMNTTWRNLLDFPAAWCSLKIILLSFGLFLVIESAGTLLSVRKYKSLALSVFIMQVVPCLGVLFGSFYFIKSLL